MSLIVVEDNDGTQSLTTLYENDFTNNLEEAFIGLLLTDKSKVSKYRKKIKPEFFADSRHIGLIKLLLNQVDSGSLDTYGQDEEMEHFLEMGLEKRELINYYINLPVKINIDFGIKSLVERYGKSVYLNACRIIEQTPGMSETDISQIWQQAAEEVERIKNETAEDVFSKNLICHGINEYLAKAERVLSGLEERPNFIDTGFKGLNNIIKGYACGNLYLVGARTGVGKTTFLINCSYNCSVDNKVLHITYEATKEYIETAFISITTGFDTMKLSAFEYSEAEHEIVCQKLMDSGVSNKQVSLVMPKDKSVQHAAELIKNARRDYDIDVVVIDHVHEMEWKSDLNSHKDNYTERLGCIVELLRDTARETNVSIICGAQLNRNSDENSKEISVRDLKHSGKLEEMADTIMLLYRDATGKDAKECTRPNDLDVMVRKNRFFPCGEAILNANMSSKKLQDKPAANTFIPFPPYQG